MIVFSEGDYEVEVEGAKAVLHVDGEVSYEELEQMLRELEGGVDAIEKSGAA